MAVRFSGCDLGANELALGCDLGANELALGCDLDGAV